MRKIEKKMLEEMRRAGRTHDGNTTVARGLDCVEVYLHGNLIAQMFPDTLKITLAGWATSTTRSRLRAICIAFTKSRGIGQRKGKQYLDLPDGTEIEINSREWYSLHRVNGGFHA